MSANRIIAYKDEFNNTHFLVNIRKEKLEGTNKPVTHLDTTDNIANAMLFTKKSAISSIKKLTELGYVAIDIKPFQQGTYYTLRFIIQSPFSFNGGDYKNRIVLEAVNGTDTKKFNDIVVFTDPNTVLKEPIELCDVMTRKAFKTKEGRNKFIQNNRDFILNKVKDSFTVEIV